MRTRFVIVMAIAATPFLTSCNDTSEPVDVPAAGAGSTTITTEPDTAAPSSSTTTTRPAPTTEATSATAAPTTTTTPQPVTTPERTVELLRRGDEGPRVALIQLKLAALGYLPAGSDSGVFDAATSRAVLAFQGDYGLIVDGLVGPQTERAISAAAESINPEG